MTWIEYVVGLAVDLVAADHDSVEHVHLVGWRELLVLTRQGHWLEPCHPQVTPDRHGRALDAYLAYVSEL